LGVLLVVHVLHRGGEMGQAVMGRSGSISLLAAFPEFDLHSFYRARRPRMNTITR
jgi:hypothetical protein